MNALHLFDEDDDEASEPVAVHAPAQTSGKRKLESTPNGTKPPPATPGAPAGQPPSTTIAPFAINPRTQVSREQFERAMSSPWMSDAQKQDIRNEREEFTLYTVLGVLTSKRLP